MRDRIAALEDGLRQLERDGGAAERFFRIRAAGLIGIENGERVRDCVVGIGQVVVGDDEVEAETARGFSFGESPHAGIDGDDQAHALGIRGLKHARLQAVALANAMRHVEAHHAAEHLDGGFEQDDGGGAVDVVIAVEQNRLARGDGLLQAVRGGLHAQHEKGIVKVRCFRIEEGEGFVGCGDAARQQQLGEHLRQMRCFGQGLGFFRMRLGDDPALAEGRSWRDVAGRDRAAVRRA